MSQDRNIYTHFCIKYENILNKIASRHNEQSDSLIILIDFDKYQKYKSFDDSIYVCNIDRFPNYALEKIHKIRSTDKNILAFKHSGLCLITTL